MHSTAKGKRSELYIMALLLENDFKVFQCLADTEGIDCVVLGRNNKFYPIQIKSRTGFAEDRDVVDIEQFTDDMFIIVYDAQTRKYWIIPSADYKDLSRHKNGTLRYRLTLTRKNSSQLAKYEGKNGLGILRSQVGP